MKKFLSLVLALTMVMSLFAMGSFASAADFTDEDDINYVEAIDVISAIGVVDGYSDGSFRPTGSLTRGAAAKIITNMILGPSTASNLNATVAPFPDVPASHTFAAPIAYCAQNGIINGYGDGNFRPDGTLTGYAFLKMLLGALGYDGAVEGFTGGNWSINVAKIADGIGLTADVDSSFTGTSAVNRQTACLFAFNTLKADLVEYDNRITATVGGVDVGIGGSNVAHSKTAQTQASQANAYNIVKEDNGTYTYPIIQFAEEYFPRLVRNDKGYDWNAEYADLVDSGLDDMGRPASKWTYRGEKIGTYSENPAVTYDGSKKLNEIYADLGMSTASKNVWLFINGVEKAASADGDKLKGSIKLELTRGNDSKLSDWSKPDYKDDDPQDPAKIGNGTIIEVFRNDKTNEIIISAQSVYGGKIASVHGANSKKDDYVKVDGGSNVPEADFHKDGHNEFETTGFSVDDVVAYTYSDSDHSIQSMYKMESVTGTLTKYAQEKNLTLGDTTYSNAVEVNYSGGISDEGQLTHNSKYVVYLDEFGYALWIEEDEFAPDAYAVILRITGEYTASDGSIKIASSGAGATTGVWDGNRAQLLFADGSKRTVDLDKSYTVQKTKATDDEYVIDPAFEAGKIIRWRQNDTGSLKLSSTGDNTKKPSGTFKIENGSVSGFSGVEFDSKTLFVVNENGDYVTYIGIRNAPNITDATNDKVHAYVKDGVCKVLFVENGKVISASKSVTFIAGKSLSKLYKATDGEDYYTYNAVVRGEIKQISVLAKQDSIDGASQVKPGKKDNVMLNRVSYNADDQVRWGQYVDVTGIDKIGVDEELFGIKKLSNNEVRIGTSTDKDATGSKTGALYTLADNAKIYLIDTDGEITAISYSDIVTDRKTQVYGIKDDGDITTLFIQQL